MKTFELTLPHLNVSLQVGDLILARPTVTQVGSIDSQVGGTSTSSSVDTNVQHVVGVLRRITDLGNGDWSLEVDDTVGKFQYTPAEGDFIMFSKYDQTVGEVIGYYAEAKFVNNSREKAEIFSVGSEITINSK